MTRDDEPTPFGIAFGLMILSFMAFGAIVAFVVRLLLRFSINLSVGCLLVATSFSGEVEVEEVQRLAPKYGGEVEVRMPDGTRCDLLTDEIAFEADWSHKWAEGVGQSLHYALMTGRRPGLILLAKDPAAEWRHLVRAARVCGAHGITLRIEKVED